MNTDILFNSLIELGLGKLEADLYLLLILGKETNITKLAQKLGVQRLRIYQALDSLEEFGLIQKRSKESKNIVLQSPSKIPALLQEKEYKFKRLSNDLNSIIPLLLKEYDSTLPHPSIKIYQGREQFILLMDQILEEEKEQIFHFGSNEHIVSLLTKDYADNWVDRRVGRKIGTREIIFRSNYIESRQEKDEDELRQIKWIPAQFDATGSYLIFANKVALWNSLLPKMIVVEDAVIVNLLKTNFEIIWELLS
jgi:sugar-specific transcriptional regulator TrmB